MNPNQVERKKNREGRKSCALLWDESFLWGLMAWRALTEAGLSFDLIRSDDIRAGILPRYAMLFVPGGWAQAKLRSLGEKGQAEIRSFVENGGSYLGICGGAGLATQSDIGLLSVSRKSFQERVPSFSGPVRLSLAPHAVWENIKSPVFSAWWPLQFRITSQNDLRILATYDEAQADAFSADIKVGERQTNGWSELEESYGIFLDPQRLKDEPAVIEGRFGQGKVLLSLVHFDTPGDQNGQAVLRNLWQYLSSDPDWPIQASRAVKKQFMADTCPECQKTIMDIKATVDTLITMGERNSLWYWRNSWFLQWRRGIRGMEYSTLAVMTGEIASYLRHNCLGGSNEGNIPAESSDLYQDLAAIKELVIPFVKKAKILLAREKSFLATAVLSPVHCSDEAISRLRQELHGSSIRHGGKFKELILAVDRLLYQLISSDQSLLR